MKDLAPDIVRQRLVIEGTCNEPISDTQIREYLSALSGELKMKTLLPPVTHLAEQFGWAGWIHWETSGAHFYAWEKPILFFSVDIYTCKKFDPKSAVEFTKVYFKSHDIQYKEV